MLRHEVDQFAGLDLGRRVGQHVGGDAGGQLHLAAVDHGQHDGGSLQLVFQLVERVAQGPGIGALQHRGQHLDALDIHRLRHQLVTLRAGQFALERGDLLLERPHQIEHRTDAGGQFRRRGLQRARQVADRGFQGLQIGQRVVAGHRLDPANACCHAALGNDLEQADVAAALHVGATAQLLAAADGQHPHGLAVLFAEQHHRAALLRVFQRHHLRRGSGVDQDLGIDDRLDAADLGVGHRGVVGKVEARAFGVDQRPLLRHMVTQHFAQGLVHQMGGAVVAHRPGALFGVHPGDEAGAHAEHALDHPALVAEHVGLDLGGVFDDHPGHRVAQLAAVARLAAAFGIERRVVEHHHHVVAGSGRRHAGAVDVQRSDLGGLALQVLVAVEGGGQAAVGQAGSHLELGRRPRLLALAAHCGIEAGLVDAETALAADVAGQVYGEAEGVVQLEGGVAVDHLGAGFLHRRQRGVQDLHAVMDGLEKALLLGLQHLGRARGAAPQLGVGLAHFGIERCDQAVEERLARAQLVAVADGAAGDAAQHVAAALVAGDHAVGDGEGAGADVVGDHLQRR